MQQQRHLFLMTILTSLSAAYSSKARSNDIIRAFIRPTISLTSTSRSRPKFVPRQSTHQLTAFNSHRYLSTDVVAAMNSPLTSLGASAHHYANSELITKPHPDPVYPEKDYVLFFAGRSRGSTIDAAAGSGMALFDSQSGREIWWGHQHLRGVSKNEADYISLISGLECARSQGVERITAQGNNDLLYQQMQGTYKVKKPSLKEFYAKAVSLSNEFDSFQLQLVEKSFNKRATKLAKMAMEWELDEDALVPVSSPSMRDESESDSNTPISSDTKDTKNQSEPASISPEKTYVLRFDGGSRGNPGIAGAGMVLYDSDDGSEIWSACQYIGDSNTNNEAEYMGLITGLQCARSLGVDHIVVQGDSQLILRQVEGTYKVRSPLLRDYYNEAMSLSREFASFETSHIERARNARADELANEAMDTKSSRGFNVS